MKKLFLLGIGIALFQGVIGMARFKLRTDSCPDLGEKRKSAAEKCRAMIKTSIFEEHLEALRDLRKRRRLEEVYLAQIRDARELQEALSSSDEEETE